MIQSTSTPPPWPPIAITAMAVGRRVSRVGEERAASIASSGQPQPPTAAQALEDADDGGAHACDRAVPAGGIDDDVGAIEGRAEHGCLRNVAAIATADAGIVDRGDRIVLQRIGGLLDRQR